MEKIMQPALVGLLTLLITVLAYIGKQVLNKIDAIRGDISNLDKHVSIIFDRAAAAEKRVDDLEGNIKEHGKEILKLRERTHDLVNKVHQIDVIAELKGIKDQ